MRCLSIEVVPESEYWVNSISCLTCRLERNHQLKLAVMGKLESKLRGKLECAAQRLGLEWVYR